LLPPGSRSTPVVLTFSIGLPKDAARHAGPKALKLLSTYWAAGDLGGLIGLLTDAGLHEVVTVTREGTAKFASIDQMVITEVESTPLFDMLTPEMYPDILVDSREVLRPFVKYNGEAFLPLVGHIVAGHRPGLMTAP
jgi:hypothetical protein